MTTAWLSSLDLRHSIRSPHSPQVELLKHAHGPCSYDALGIRQAISAFLPRSVDPLHKLFDRSCFGVTIIASVSIPSRLDEGLSRRGWIPSVAGLKLNCQGGALRRLVCSEVTWETWFADAEHILLRAEIPLRTREARWKRPVSCGLFQVHIMRPEFLPRSLCVI